MVREREYNGLPGIPMLLVLLALDCVAGLDAGPRPSAARNAVAIVVVSIAVAVTVFLLFGLFMVNPNQGKVLQLFGEYRGTAKVQGLRWANPLLTKKAVSLRVRNFESSRLKVNDNEGNPIEIAAVVVWKVVETAEAVFEVDDFENYVHVQSESALRNLATSYPYDAHDEHHDLAARSHVGGRRSPQARDSGAPGQGRRRGDRGAHQPPRLRARRSPPRCCSGSRPARSSPPASASSRARSAWSRWRSACCRTRGS